MLCACLNNIITKWKSLGSLNYRVLVGSLRSLTCTNQLRILAKINLKGCRGHTHGHCLNSIDLIITYIRLATVNKAKQKQHVTHPTSMVQLVQDCLGRTPLNNHIALT